MKLLQKVLIMTKRCHKSFGISSKKIMIIINILEMIIKFINLWIATISCDNLRDYKLWQLERVSRIWILCWFFCVITLMRFHNTLITTNFNILKYIKKIFKWSTQYIFLCLTEDNTKKISKKSGLKLEVQVVVIHSSMINIWSL